MFYIIMNDGGYQELPYAKTKDEADAEMHTMFTAEEIDAKDMGIIDDSEED